MSGKAKADPVAVVLRTEAQVEKAASRNESRPVIQHPYLQMVEWKTGRGRNRRTHRRAELQATNSYMFVRIPLRDADTVAAGQVPTEVIVYARKRKAVIHVEGDRFVLRTDDTMMKEVASFPRPAPVDFPNVAKLDWPEGEPQISVGINPNLLADLGVALNASEFGVRLDIYNPLKPIRVTPLRSVGLPEGAEAILMPIRLKEQP